MPWNPNDILYIHRIPEWLNALLLTGPRLKQQCIPRLKLNGQYCWPGWCSNTDRHYVAMRRGHANVWPTFIANRVSEVQATMAGTQWHLVTGVDNPADVASRWIMSSEIRTHPLWWTGPQWLQSERDSWPEQTPLVVDEKLLETKKGASCLVAHTRTMPELGTRYSFQNCCELGSISR